MTTATPPPAPPYPINYGSIKVDQKALEVLSAAGISKYALLTKHVAQDTLDTPVTTKFPIGTVAGVATIVITTDRKIPSTTITAVLPPSE